MPLHPVMLLTLHAMNACWLVSTSATLVLVQPLSLPVCGHPCVTHACTAAGWAPPPQHSTARNLLAWQADAVAA